MSSEEAVMPSDRVRTLMAVLLLLALFLGSLAGCGGGGGSPGDPNSPIKLQAASSGSLAVAVYNLPVGAAASVQVSGPANFAAALAGSQTLTDVAPGEYTVTALPVVAGAITWLPAPATQPVLVAAGTTTTASVDYAPAGP
jgi:hypothetical protein